MPYFNSSDGLRLHYTDEGEGLPILCLAGLTRSTADFDYMAPHLPPCRLIRLDYRGRGRSDWDANWQNYALPIEIGDVLALLDHLSLDAVAILGTSRGGLNAMGLAATAPERMLGTALNDVGPELAPQGLATIMTYLGHPPASRTHNEAAAALAHVMTGFHNVPAERWMQEAMIHFHKVDDGLNITYDPDLRRAIETGGDVPDLWPFFDALAGKPLCLIRGANSELLRMDTVQKMRERRPDMIFANVPDRGHIPFLDEPEALAALHHWIEGIS